MSDQKKPTRYSPDFRQLAVKLAVERDLPISQAVKDLGVNENTLHNWIGYQAPLAFEAACSIKSRKTLSGKVLPDQSPASPNITPRFTDLFVGVILRWANCGLDYTRVLYFDYNNLVLSAVMCRFSRCY